jgi:dTDP-4-amino-4,6-dideoxygalactose transaminase
MTTQKIPFNRAAADGHELEYIADAIRQGRIAGDGPYTKQCNQLLESVLSVPRVMLTTNCTHALEMSALLLGLQPEDEVILPSFTFVSTANAYILRGAKLIFGDCRPDTLNLDERLLPDLITDRTKLIVPMHYAGVGCEMDGIMKLAGDHDISVVEDNAHGLFGRYKGQYLGTFGTFGTQSFHETKNFTCGEGGALVINDPDYVQQAEIVREKGTNRSRFFRGEIDKYTWVEMGSSYLPSDILAAFLYAQLERREEIQAYRRDIWEYYHQHLGGWAEANDVQLQYVPPDREQSYHMYYFLMPTAEIRSDVLTYLKANGVHAVFHYLPLHLSGCGRRMGWKPGDCPVTEDVSERLVRLPFHNQLSRADQDRVIEVLTAFAP